MKFNKIQQLGIGIGIVALVTFVTYFVVLKDKRTQIDTLVAKNQTLEGDIRVARAIQQRVMELREEMGQLTAQLERLKDVLPTEVNKPKLMADVKRYANENGLEVIELSQNKPVIDDVIVEHPFTVKALGGYHDFGQFFANLSDYPRIINVKGLALNVPKDVQTVEGSFLVSVFTYKEPTAEELKAQIQAEKDRRSGKGKKPGRGRR